MRQLVDPRRDTSLWSETYDGDLANMANILAIQANIAVRRTPGFKRLLTDLELAEYWRRNGWPQTCRAIGSDDFECYGARLIASQ